MSSNSSNNAKAKNSASKSAQINLYRRVFGDVIKKGSENHRKLTSTMRTKALEDCKIHVKGDEYIDVDLYGRGDPRVARHAEIINNEANKGTVDVEGMFQNKLGGLLAKKVRSLFSKLSGAVGKRNTSRAQIPTPNSESGDDSTALRK